MLTTIGAAIMTSVIMMPVAGLTNNITLGKYSHRNGEFSMVGNSGTRQNKGAMLVPGTKNPMSPLATAYVYDLVLPR
eukprot:m.105019 g.105019  ORF g.105019 m.105019 type:complete len:77 (-) comp27613_c0_seq1:92-322(-)